jgi:hypothetical protein
MSIAILIGLTSMQASAATRFGAKLTEDTFPSNAGKGHECVDKTTECTWVMMQACGRPDEGYKAPKDGEIGRVRLISCYKGEFQLQLARANNNTDEGRVVRDGPVIKFNAEANKCDGPTYEIQTIELKKPLQVKKGDQLAIRTPKTTILRCDSGGDKILLFAPPLVAGESPRPALDGDGCWLLLEAEYDD